MKCENIHFSSSFSVFEKIKKEKKRKKGAYLVMGETPIASVKIVILGEMNVGKTCVINRYVHGIYTDFIANSIGTSFSDKKL